MPFTYECAVPGLFYQLWPEEEVLLQPGMLIKIGTITFLCERFNTGVVSTRGSQYRMEDAYCVQ